MTRFDAVKLLVRRDLAKLSMEGREALLLDWWSIDATDPEYDALPDLLRKELMRADPTEDPSSSLFDPLLEIALRRSYVGVLNSYLEREIGALFGRRETVEGEIEELATCPCCGYRSLREKGEYEICRVCFWEDDGTTDLDRISHPNHMTLREARLNFERLGAVAQEARKYVLQDGKERYYLNRDAPFKPSTS